MAAHKVNQGGLVRAYKEMIADSEDPEEKAELIKELKEIEGASDSREVIIEE